MAPKIAARKGEFIKRKLNFRLSRGGMFALGNSHLEMEPKFSQVGNSLGKLEMNFIFHWDKSSRDKN